MNPNDEYKELVSKLVSCRNIFELKNMIKEVNTFIVRYQIPDRSETFLKLKNLIDLIKIKLKKKKGIDEAVEFIGNLMNTQLLSEQKENINPKNLKLGDGGEKNPSQKEDVIILQTKLIKLGLLSIKNPTGFFGKLTQKALDRYNGKVEEVLSTEDKERAKPAIDYFIGKNFTPEQAAGIASNLHYESGFNPVALGDNGKSFGIAQWRDDRRENLVKFAKKRNLPLNDVNTQLRFIWHELDGNPKDGGGTEKKAYDKIKQATTPADSALTWVKFYERASLPKEELRKQGAEEIHSYYSNKEA